MSYIGTQPIPKATRVLTEGVLQASSQTINIPGGYTPGNIQVHINGILWQTDQYTATDGFTVDLLESFPSGTEYVVLEFRNFVVAQTATTELTGVVEKATTTEAQAGTADKYPDAAGVHAAFEWYGLKTARSLGISADLNAVVSSGFYRLEGSVVNGPGTGDFGQLIVSRGNDTIFQIATGYSDSRFYMRHGSGIGGTPVWQPWRELFHQANILGTVSQSAGVPTGAVLEYISNTNGKALRYADGTQIAWNDNVAITASPATFVGTITKVDTDKIWIGRWY